MFIGRYQHTIDPKGRVSIPARYRTTLAQYEGNLIVVPQEQCLDVYPFTAWERVVGALNDQSQFDERLRRVGRLDRKSTRLNSSHANISYAVFCLKKKK